MLLFRTGEEFRETTPPNRKRYTAVAGKVVKTGENGDGMIFYGGGVTEDE